MQYMLGVGFVIKKYKKNPTVRIFADDVFIDEFEIDRYDSLNHPLVVDKLKYCFGGQEPDPPCPSLAGMEEKNDHTTFRKVPLSFNSYPKYWKTYVLDDSVLKDKKQIKLMIENNDTNHTNGFMTNSTLIDLRHIFLLPTSLLKHFNSGRENFYKNIGRIIPKKYNGVGFTTGHPTQFRYPFPFRYNWRGTELSRVTSVGGSGVLTLDLDRLNDVIMFDAQTNDATIVDLDEYDVYNIRKIQEVQGLPQQKEDDIVKNGNVPFFPICRYFFTLAGELLKDKYKI